MKLRSKIFAVIAVLMVVVLVGSLSIGCKKAEAAGGVFRAYIQQPVSLDPPFTVESEGIQVVRQIWDGLFDYDRKTLELVPELCEKWEVSDDGLVYTFHIKKGVKFHDGSPLVAEDFVYSWTRVALAETAAPLAYHLAPIKGYDDCADGSSTTLEGVKALDENTLQVTLSYPYADFVTTLGHLVFYPVKQADIEKWGEEYTKHVNGTGPFKFVEWIDDQHIRLVRNDDYYGEKAKLDGVDYKIFADDNTAMLEFKAGNLEYTLIPLGKIKATTEDPKYKDYCFTSPMLALNFYGLSFGFPLFAENPKLREAMNYAIDRENICEVLYEGIPSPMTGFVPPGIPGFQENAAPYTYDLEKAKQLLAEAGFPNGEGVPTLKFGYNTGSGHEIIGEAIQSELKSIGINMELEGYEWATLLDKAKSGEVSFFRLSWGADYPTMDNFLFPLFYSESYDNFAGYNNPEVDKLLIEARSTRDEAQRVAKYREVEKMVINDNAFLLIYFYGLRHVIQPYVKGFEMDAMANYDLSKVWLEQ
jgi:peptide/nickel transport system substrate-binding protein/oligopeptide transport system substrate-binding protein